MSDARTESPRRLAAVLAADVAGYSRLMGIDEEGTLARLKRHRRDLIEPTVTEHYGRIVKTTGDGFLAEFNSPVEAVRCAIVIQQSMAGRNATLPRDQHITFRIGVNLGDIIIDRDGDIYGDGVNIAARLETLCEPGNVYISGGVYEQVKSKLVVGYQSLGNQKVKNITDPVRVYKVLPDLHAIQQVKRSRWAWGVAAAVVLFMLVGAGAWFYAGQPRLIAAWIVEDPAPQQAQPTPVALPAPMPTTPPPIDPNVLTERRVEPETVVPVVRPEPPPVPLTEPTRPEPSQLAMQPLTTQAQTAVATLARPNPVTRPTPLVPFRDCPDCPEMVLLPGGSFSMGSNEDPSEKPVRRVTVLSFAIGRYPVTVQEWNRCVADGDCTLVPMGDDRSPVHNLSWQDAHGYAGWLSRLTGMKYRLPSEAEWEYAARANTETSFWWGDAKPMQANCKGCGQPYLAANPLNVGSFSANAFGLYDMGGNVAQWVQDCWHRNYDRAPIDGRAWEEPNCRARVLRGGHWRSDASYARSASRANYDVGVRYPGHGVRVARTP